LRKIISGEGGQTITGRTRHNILTDAMPNWGKVFTDHQIDALIPYLRYLSTAKFVLLGNPVQGGRLYQKYWSVCHGGEGYGDGVMTQILEMESAAHTTPLVMHRKDNEELIAAILVCKGEYMPAWDGILKREEVEALVSYIRLLTQ